MLKSESDFDEERNLAQHYVERAVKLDVRQEQIAGDCTVCASVRCLYNVTAREVFALLDIGEFQAVKQYNCDDQVDDETVPLDLRYF